MDSLYKSHEYRSDLETALRTARKLDILKGKTIMITGATGLIGSFLVDMLCTWNATLNDTEKVHIIATSRKIEKLEKRFAMAPEKEFIRFLKWDLTDSDFLFHGHINYIIHAAGNAHPAAFTSDPAGTIVETISGVHNLLKFSRNNNIDRLLYVSSGEVYGEGSENVFAFYEKDYGYVDPLNPRSCYPTAKRAAENLCISYAAQYGLDVVIARPCHTYGPNMTDSDNRATAQFIASAIKKEPIIMKSLGQQIRSYCYIPDCVSAVLTILLNGNSLEAYNIANSGVCLSIAEFAQLTADLANVPLTLCLDDELAKRQKTFITRGVLASKKLEALGWSGQYPIKAGISHTLNILKCLCNGGYE